MESLVLKQNRFGLTRAPRFDPLRNPQRSRGRGARSNFSGRHDTLKRLLFDDGWQSLEQLPDIETRVVKETARTAITTNKSPDIWFDRSVNPYRGCEHGCCYCFARPSHANLGLSPGLDFESRLFAKTNIADILRKQFCSKRYKPRPIAVGVNTDAYQPIERKYRLTRQILKVMIEFSHPVAIVTKSALVLRDVDLLSQLAERQLVKVAISVTSQDHRLSRSLEPRASAPSKRLQALEVLSRAGIPTSVLVAPVIPAINDHEIEKILAAASAAGATEAGFIMLRLPGEIRDQFKQWLMAEYPDKAAKVISLVRSLHAGKDYNPDFYQRRAGSGPYAWSVARRFELAAKRLKLNRQTVQLNSDIFERPPQPGEQLKLL